MFFNYLFKELRKSLILTIAKLLRQVVKDIKIVTLNTILVLQKTLLATLFRINYIIAFKST